MTATAPRASGSRWTLAATFSSFEAAQIAAGMLRANGVDCVINNATIASVYPMTDTWAPLELMVPAPQASLAEQLLKADGDDDQ